MFVASSCFFQLLYSCWSLKLFFVWNISFQFVAIIFWVLILLKLHNGNGHSCLWFLLKRAMQGVWCSSLFFPLFSDSALSVSEINGTVATRLWWCNQCLYSREDKGGLLLRQRTYFPLVSLVFRLLFSISICEVWTNMHDLP